jgi:protein phosphatase
MAMVEASAAYCVPGNHDVKLMRKLRGRDVQITHGLQNSLEPLEIETPLFWKKVADFVDGPVSQ